MIDRTCHTILAPQLLRRTHPQSLGLVGRVRTKLMNGWHRRVVAAAGILLAVVTAAMAARMEHTSRPHPSGDEIVVFEVKNCIYCALFRRDVLPGYRLSRRGRSVPIRFLDARRPAAQAAGLKAPLQQVPTIVVFRRGQEVGRITGYTGPSAFYQLLNRIFRQAL